MHQAAVCQKIERYVHLHARHGLGRSLELVLLLLRRGGVQVMEERVVDAVILCGLVFVHLQFDRVDIVGQYVRPDVRGVAI